MVVVVAAAAAALPPSLVPQPIPTPTPTLLLLPPPPPPPAPLPLPFPPTAAVTDAAADAATAAAAAATQPHRHPVPQIERNLDEVDADQRTAWAARLCCALVHRSILPCNLGCAPWRVQPTPQCRSPRGRSSELPLGLEWEWPEPAPRGVENFSLKVHKKQTWPSGAMKCDLCEGHFNGWRGY